MLKADFHLYTLKLRTNWSIASRRGRDGRGIRERGVALLRLVDEPTGICGFGEAAPVSTYGESLLDVFADLRRIEWDRLSFARLSDSLDYLNGIDLCSSVRNAVEMALLDGMSRQSGKGVGELLGLDADSAGSVATSYSIGISSPREIEQAAGEAGRFGTIKLKAGVSGLEESLKAFRSVSPDARLRIDANEAWSTKEFALQQIELIHRYGPVEFVEQPMPRDASLEDLVWLKERSPLPLLADESFVGIHDLERCLSGFHGVNVKLVKCGGPAASLACLTAARKAGLKTQLGCMIESSLGIAAALALAPLADWIDLDGALLTANDPFDGIVERQGSLSFKSKKRGGLGVEPVSDFWTPQAAATREISQRGVLELPCEVYGRSVNGLPLEVYLPASGVCDVLIFAAIHGEEPETTALLSKALRHFDQLPQRTACVLCSNPDGTLLGTRGNANGVELNRNFPASNWRPGTVSMKWAPSHGTVEYSTGDGPASEPETRALMRLVERLQPGTIVALHAPLACIDDPEYSPLGYQLAKAAKLPLVGEIGYETPGSFGSWAREKGYHVITYELPPISVSAMHEEHIGNMLDLLREGGRPKGRSVKFG